MAGVRCETLVLITEHLASFNEAPHFQFNQREIFKLPRVHFPLMFVLWERGGSVSEPQN